MAVTEGEHLEGLHRPGVVVGEAFLKEGTKSRLQVKDNYLTVTEKEREKEERQWNAAFASAPAVDLLHDVEGVLHHTYVHTRQEVEDVQGTEEAHVWEAGVTQCSLS